MHAENARATSRRPRSHHLIPKKKKNATSGISSDRRCNPRDLATRRGSSRDQRSLCRLEIDSMALLTRLTSVSSLVRTRRCQWVLKSRLTQYGNRCAIICATTHSVHRRKKHFRLENIFTFGVLILK